MTHHITVDPVVLAINALSRWAWHQVLGLTSTWMQRLVFQPLGWSHAVNQFYSLSRDLAWSLSGVLILWVFIRMMWPSLNMGRPSMSATLLLERLVTAAAIGMAGSWLVSMLLDINNALVRTLIGQVSNWQPEAAPSGVLSPLVILVISLAMVALMLYLAIFYAVRAIELYVLVATLPWFALWWATRSDDTVLSNYGREIVAVIFIQSLHAAAFWLAMRLVANAGSSLFGFFTEIAMLWYMTRLPGQFRRLLGAHGAPLWR